MVRIDPFLVQREEDCPVNIYVKYKDTYILYKDRFVAVDTPMISRIGKRDIDSLYVKEEDYEVFNEYQMESYLSFVKDYSQPLENRLKVLYASSRSIMKSLFENPHNDKVFNQSKPVIENFVGMIFKENISIDAITSLISHDYYTYTHSINVMTYTVFFFNKYEQYPEDVLLDIGTGMLYHDIGKSRVSTDIIRKHGPLTEEKWSEMKTHPVSGFDIVSKRGKYSQITLDIILHHHEKIDGSGYPSGQTEKDIGDIVKVATISDIYDALTTNRNYSKARTPFEALSFMKEIFLVPGKEKLHRGLFEDFVRMLVTSS